MGSFERIKEEAKQILTSLGRVYRSDNSLDYSEPVKQKCSYEGYGLKIISYDLPAYVDHNYTKDHINDSYIIFNNKIVFDSKNNIYISGSWENILTEIYNKIPVFLKNKEKQVKSIQHQSQLFENVIYKLIHKGVWQVNDITIQCESKHNSYKDYNGETVHYYKVLKNNEIVFHIEEHGFNNFYYYDYKPGAWEQELKNYLNLVETQEQQKQEKEFQKNLKLLRSLK